MTIKVLIYLDTILCILCFCAYGQTGLDSDTSTLYIDLKRPSCNNTVFTLLEGEPARIRTEPLYLNYAFYNNKNLTINDIFNTDRNKTFEISLIDKDPGKKNITFLTLKGVGGVPNPVTFDGGNYSAIYCEPTFHVRLKQTPLTVAINDMVLQTKRTNLSVTDHDAVDYYMFRDGELVDISCGKLDEYGKLVLKYRNMETMTVHRASKLSTAYALRLQVKLELRDSGSYFTCKIENENDFATVRVYFRPESKPEDDITVRVNGLKLRPSTGGDKRVLQFSYKFKYGESVKVSCEKREGLHGSLRFDSKDAKCENDNAYCVAQKEFITDTWNLECEHFYESQNILKANIHLISDDMQEFYILGIPPDHIMYQYRRNQEQKIIESEYEYTDGEVLNITCMKNKVSPNIVYMLQWDFPDEDVPENTVKRTPIKSSFNLTSASQNKELKCLVYELIPDPRDPNTETKELYLTIAVKLTMRKCTTTTTLAPVTSTDKEVIENNPGPNKLILYGIGGGLCILILIMTLMVYSISKRKKDRKRDSNINYENLPHNSDNTMPTPTQWNEDQYARPVDLREDTETYSIPYNQKNVEKLYAKPQPKILRSKPNGNYHNIEPTYSEVGKLNVQDCNDPNYAQVLPKSLRNNLEAEDKSNYANVTNSSNYAEVLPKNQRKNYVLPKDGSNYAQIAAEVLQRSDNSNNYVNLKNESNYAEVVQSSNNRNKYVNVIPNNEPYANVNSSDYAEPAYCELNIKK